VAQSEGLGEHERPGDGPAVTPPGARAEPGTPDDDALTRAGETLRGGPNPAEKGLSRLLLGGILGIVASVLAVDLAVTVIDFVLYGQGTLLPIDPRSVRVVGALLLIGDVLYLISIFLYRRSFAQLRAYESRLKWASALGLVGSIGFGLLVVVSGIVLGDPQPLVGCLHGPLSELRACFQASLPVGEYSALVGFVCSWIGAWGVGLGFLLSARPLRQPWIFLGGILYLLFALLLAVPFVAAYTPVSGFEYLDWALPTLALLGPLCVLLGSFGAWGELRPKRSGEPVAPGSGH